MMMLCESPWFSFVIDQNHDIDVVMDLTNLPPHIPRLVQKIVYIPRVDFAQQELRRKEALKIVVDKP